MGVETSLSFWQRKGEPLRKPRCPLAGRLLWEEDLEGAAAARRVLGAETCPALAPRGLHARPLSPPSDPHHLHSAPPQHQRHLPRNLPTGRYETALATVSGTQVPSSPAGESGRAARTALSVIPPWPLGGRRGRPPGAVSGSGGLRRPAQPSPAHVALRLKCRSQGSLVGK